MSKLKGCSVTLCCIGLAARPKQDYLMISSHWIFFINENFTSILQASRLIKRTSWSHYTFGNTPNDCKTFCGTRIWKRMIMIDFEFRQRMAQDSRSISMDQKTYRHWPSYEVPIRNGDDCIRNRTERTIFLHDSSSARDRKSKAGLDKDAHRWVRMGVRPARFFDALDVYQFSHVSASEYRTFWEILQSNFSTGGLSLWNSSGNLIRLFFKWWSDQKISITNCPETSIEEVIMLEYDLYLHHRRDHAERGDLID